MSKLPFILSAFALAAATSARAKLVNIDINNGSSSSSTTFSGAAVIGSAGDVWNGVSIYGGNQTDHTKNDLKDAEGNPTALSVKVNTDGGHYYTAAVRPSTTPPGDASELMRDYGYHNDGNWMGVEIGGLDPAKAYKLVVYSHGDTQNQNCDLRLRENEYGEGTLEAEAVRSTGVWSGEHTLEEGVDYVVFGHVVPNGSGVIGIEIKGKDTEFGVCNGLQIEEANQNRTSGVLVEISSLGFLSLLMIGGLLYQNRAVTRVRDLI